LKQTNSSIAWKIEITFPNLQIYSPKEAKSEKLGSGVDNPGRIVFFEFADEQVLGEG
jgi:hypothetical protein